MPRKVNFTSFSDDAGLPDITSGQNWVNERQRRFHSEPRPAAGISSNHGNGTLLPSTLHNGHLVTRGDSYGNHGDIHDTVQANRRLKSLPPTKPKTDSVDKRQVRSAPNKDDVKGQGSNLQPDVQQRTHGKATKTYEVTYLKSHKFASSWAQVRADNPAFNDFSPTHSPRRQGNDHNNRHHSPDSGIKGDSTRDSSPSNHEDPKRNGVRKERKSRPPYKTRGRVKSRHNEDNKHKEKSPARIYTSGNESDGQYSNDEYVGSPNSSQNRERKISKKVEWDDSVVIGPYENPPPKHATLRYLDGLKFKPNINTKRAVSKAYTSVVKTSPSRNDDRGLDSSFSEAEDLEEGYDSPDDEMYNSPIESGDEESKERSSKERFLNRREARKYIKMTNVYGSEAFKNQRKEWFLQKLAEVQGTKAKLEADQIREEMKKREEDKKRQKRQLDYVRKKFRTEQEHRFRTQYVTARVLEHEQANRHVYGLPEDFLDLGNEINRALFDDDKASGTDGAEDNKENVSNTGISNQNKKNKESLSSKKKGQISSSNTGPVKKKKSPEKDVAKKKQKEALEKVRQDQTRWYAKTERDSTSSAPDARSHGSHATSGYESEKLTQDHQNSPPESNNNMIHTAGGPQDTQKRDEDVNVKSSPRGNAKPNNRFESQRNIYSKKPKTKPPIPSQVRGNKTNGKPSESHQTEKGALQKKSQITPNPGERKTDSDIGTSDQPILRKDESTPNVPSSSKDNAASSHNQLHKFKVGSENNGKSNQSPMQGLDGLSESGVKDKNKSQTENTNHNAPSNQNQPLQSVSSSNINSKANDTLSKEPNDRQQKNAKRKSSFESAHRVDSKIKPHLVQDSNRNKTHSDAAKTTASKIESGNTVAGNTSKDAHNIPFEKNKDDKSKNPSFQRKSDTPEPVQPKQIASTATDEAPKAKMAESKSNQIPVSKRLDNSKNNSNTQPTQNKTPSQVQELSGVPSSHTNENKNMASGKQKSSVPPAIIAPVKSSGIKTNQELPSLSSKTADNQNKRSSAVAPSNSQHNPRIPSSQKADSRGKDSAHRDQGQQNPGKKKDTLADRMFNIKTGPTWNPNQKTPKMEGIDSVIVTTKDKKGRDVKKRKTVDDVVKEADGLLKVSNKDDFDRTSRRSRAVSPDVTLGSDFDVDEEDDVDDDIFERLRKKYNIQIDSDEDS